MTIKDDAVIEDNEAFDLIFQNHPPSSGITVSAIARETITIKDAGRFGLQVTVSREETTRVTVGRAMSSEYCYTLVTGTLAACQTSLTAVLDVTVPEATPSGRTVTFSLPLSSVHGDLDASLLAAATLTFQGALPAKVAGVSVQPGNGELTVS